MSDNPTNDKWRRYTLYFNQLGQSRTVLNFLSLGFLKATDAVVLLLLIPLIISRIGIANFGIVAFVQVILNYGKTMIDYGFHITGIRMLALRREDHAALSTIFSNILFSRLFIWCIFTLVLFAAIQVIPFLKEREWLFYWGFLLPLGHVFFTDWFFIGVQQAHFIALANLIIKLLFAGSVFFLIRVPADYIYLLGFQGLAGFSVGLLTIVGIYSWTAMQLTLPSKTEISSCLRQDFRLLLSNLAIEFNASYSILILGVLTSDAVTGYFNVMFKLVQSIRFLLVIFSQAIFPRVCEKTKEGWQQVQDFLRSAISVFFWIPVLCSFLMMVFAKSIYLFFAHSADPQLLSSFRLYLLVPIIVLANIPAYQLLLAYDRKSDYTTVYLLSMSLKIVLDYIFIKLFGLPGLISSLLLIEGFITLGLWLMLKKNRQTMIHTPYTPER